MRLYFMFFFLYGLIATNAQQSEKLRSVEEFQKKINSEFLDEVHSPLTPADRKTFKSLSFFPVDTSFIVTAEFVRTPFELPFEMPTTTERKPVYVKYGELYFYLKGKEYKLNVYQNQQLKLEKEYRDYLFLPFTDETNGITSYSGGRYIDLRIPKLNTIVLDFNKAYNPYCAYNGKYSCPVPPPENDLDLPVPAGVKAYNK